MELESRRPRACCDSSDFGKPLQSFTSRTSSDQPSSFFFPSIMAGPASDFATYDALVRGTLFTSPPATNASSALAASDAKEAVKQHRKSKIPARRKTVAYEKLAVGLLFLAIYAAYGGKASHERILDGKWWYSHSKFWRFGFIQLAGFMARSKYYAVWTVAEASTPFLPDLWRALTQTLDNHREPAS
jgi:hypothetical protein